MASASSDVSPRAREGGDAASGLLSPIYTLDRIAAVGGVERFRELEAWTPPDHPIVVDGETEPDPMIDVRLAREGLRCLGFSLALSFPEAVAFDHDLVGVVRQPGRGRSARGSGRRTAGSNRRSTGFGSRRFVSAVCWTRAGHAGQAEAALASKYPISLCGEVAERSKAAVLKTADPPGSGGSNPSLSASLSRFAASGARPQ